MVGWTKSETENTLRCLRMLLALPLLFSFFTLPASAAINLKNVSETLEELIEGYDIRLRPKFGGKALVVDIDIIIASFDAISEVNMDYTITMYLNQYWRDERLEWGDPSEKMTLTADFADRIWVPDTFFANDKHSFLHQVTESNKMIRLSGDGSIAYGMRFTTTLACMMDLLFYPLDIQNCTVEIESYGYPMEDVEMRWRVGRNSIVGVENVDLPQFELVDFDTLSTIQVLASGAYQRLSLSFLLKRHIGYFIFQTFLPSILIVMLSWVSFWINHEATSARVGLGITTVLTMTTISTGVRASLPRISYVKAIDIYLVMCFVFVFVALMEYAAVNYCFWGARAKKKKKKHQQQQALAANTSTADHFSQPFGVCQSNGRVSMSNRGNDSKMIGFEHLNNCADHGSGAENKLNETGDIELTEVSPLNQPHNMTESAFSDDEYNPVNNNSNDYTVQRDLTPRLRRPQGFVTARNGKGSRWGNFRQKTKTLKMPKVKDVNNIDKYSRLVFPLLFLLFNAWYWVYYSVLSNMVIKGTPGK